MADCNAFVGEWKIKTVTHYDEIVEHVISIRQDGHKYAVRCESHGRDYAKATCIDGVLRGDDGYEIRLKPELRPGSSSKRERTTTIKPARGPRKTTAGVTRDPESSRCSPLRTRAVRSPAASPARRRKKT